MQVTNQHYMECDLLLRPLVQPRTQGNQSTQQHTWVEAQIGGFCEFESPIL